jgi:hypothetical protein
VYAAGLPLKGARGTGNRFELVAVDNESPAKRELFASLRDSGVSLGHASHVVVRDLTCEYFANDGFNIHGSSFALRFHNIRSRNNGDDGFSIHEDGEATVYGGCFENNYYGIEDVNASRSFYNGVLIRNNATGVHFSGGSHGLTDCRLEDNSRQILVNAGRPSTYLGTDASSAVYAGSCRLKNTSISGGGIGLLIEKRSHVLVMNSLFQNCASGIEVSTGGELVLRGSVLSGCQKADLTLGTQAVLQEDCNLYWPGRVSAGGRVLSLEGLKQYGGTRSVFQKPEFQTDNRQVKTQPFMDRSPRMRLGLE